MPENESFVFDTNLGVKVRFLPGAHKHGVQVEDQLHVLDAEVIAIPGTREHFLVIHAMPMRKKWQPLWNWMQQGGSS